MAIWAAWELPCRGVSRSVARKIKRVAAILPTSNAETPTISRPSCPRRTGRILTRRGSRTRAVESGAWRIAYKIAATANRPGITDSSALRAGTRSPRAAHAPALRTPTCHVAEAAPTSDERMAVAV